MKYYLETNCLINASRLLEDSGVSSKCFVSILGLLELITDLNDEVFGSKRIAIRRVLDSAVEIDWRLPQTIIFDSFGIRTACTIVEREMRMVMEAMVQADGKRQFFDTLKVQQLYGVYGEMERHDSQYNMFLPAQLEEMAENIAISDLRCDAKLALSYLEQANDNRSEYFSPEIRGEMVRHVVQKVAEDLAATAFNCESLTPCEVLTRYDNTLDAFLGIFYLYSLKKVSRREKVKRNDITDLHHLIYLKDGDIIVSDDKLLRKASQSYLPGSICTCSEFKSYFMRDN